MINWHIVRILRFIWAKIDLNLGLIYNVSLSDNGHTHKKRLERVGRGRLRLLPMIQDLEYTVEAAM